MGTSKLVNVRVALVQLLPGRVRVRGFIGLAEDKVTPLAAGQNETKFSDVRFEHSSKGKLYITRVGAKGTIEMMRWGLQLQVFSNRLWDCGVRGDLIHHAVGHNRVPDTIVLDDACIEGLETIFRD